MNWNVKKDRKKKCGKSLYEVYLWKKLQIKLFLTSELKILEKFFLNKRAGFEIAIEPLYGMYKSLGGECKRKNFLRLLKLFVSSKKELKFNENGIITVLFYKKKMKVIIFMIRRILFWKRKKTNTLVLRKTREEKINQRYISIKKNEILTQPQLLTLLVMTRIMQTRATTDFVIRTGSSAPRPYMMTMTANFVVSRIFSFFWSLRGSCSRSCLRWHLLKI